MKRCVDKTVELIRKKRLDRLAIGSGRCDDEDWITINGTHIQVGPDGKLKGHVGAKIEDRNGTGERRLKRFAKGRDNRTPSAIGN